ncbi:hypothetical protein ACSBR2_027486 [Camellia fascicularis]
MSTVFSIWLNLLYPAAKCSHVPVFGSFPLSNPSIGFDCNICLDSAQDPVVTLCSHLYCWPCIYKWIHFQSVSAENPDQQKPQCPVLKAEV